MNKMFHRYSEKPEPKPRPNPYLHLSNWEYQKHWVEPLLGPGDVVLDIGSGHQPCPRADIWADFFPHESIHRNHHALADDRPVVICSVERLPFLAKSFPFVICSHVLEHVASPRNAVDEIYRVGEAGYLETPAYGKDVLIGTGHVHRWQVVEFAGTMHFFEYSQRQSEGHVRSPVMDLWTQAAHHSWQDFFWERQDLFNVCLLWKEKPVVIEHRREQGEGYSLEPWQPVARDLLPMIPCQLTSSEISLLLGRLATPDGSRPMRFEEQRFIDDGGNIVYPVRGKRIYCEMPA